MITPPSAREKSRKKHQILRDPLVSAAFYQYFAHNWQAQEVLDMLQAFGADIELLREFAIYSFHPLGRDEAEERRKRGVKVRSLLKKAIAGYKSAMEVYSWYAFAPHHGIPALRTNTQRFKELYEANENLAKAASEWLATTAKNRKYTTKRLGVSWQSFYLFSIKAYIGCLASWKEAQILEAITHLVAAAQKSVNYRVPDDLRALLRKAIRKFESHSLNADIIGLLRHSASNPTVFYEMFPPLSSKPSRSRLGNPETK